MNQNQRKIFIINDQQIIHELSPTFYHDFILQTAGVQLTDFKGQRLRLAEIHLEVGSEGPSSIITAEFRYLFVSDDGALDKTLFAEFIQSGIDAVKNNTANDPESAYRKRFFWSPTHDEFKTLMSLALKKEMSSACKVMESYTLPIDNSDPMINGIRKMLAAFPGIRVVGNNRSLHFWSITLDIVNSYGLISLLFLREGLKHEQVKSASLTLSSPDNDMRYVLSCNSFADVKKVSVWMIYIYQKRLQYKDMNSQSTCSCGE
ncbi:MAG: hypothetical protein HQK75_11915 [Candidatus Magnetomorum sp.]|nr:hypothetical protein [Candidatus Magnetomorum sp.]